MLKKAVQFGAGNIGRGFLAELFTQSGYRVVFVEVDQKIISLLNTNKQYMLKIVGKNPRKLLIKNVSAVNASDVKALREEISSADVAATAVGVNALPGIVPLIVSGIECRCRKNIKRPLNIIVCENVLNAGEVLKGYVRDRLPQKYHDYLDKNVGFVDTVASRMIPPVPEGAKKNDPLLVIAEEYNVLPVSREGFVGSVPDIKGIIPYDDLSAYEQRKLFIHNLGHSMCAYAGYQKGYVYIWQAVRDNDLISIVKNALAESSRALIKRYGFSKREMSEHVDDLIERFGNRALGDTVYRVGRDPVRKLGPDDRLIGSAKLCLEFNIEPVHIVKGIVFGLRYDYDNDKKAVELQCLMNEKGIDYVLENVCSLGENDRLANLIRKEFLPG